MPDGTKRKFRPTAWFDGQDKDGFIHRSWMRVYPTDLFDGRPINGNCRDGR